MVKVGDRIEVLSDAFWASEGERGTVVEVSGMIGINFDTYDPRRHDCDGLCENGHGFWYYPDELEDGTLRVVPKKRNNLLV